MNTLNNIEINLVKVISPNKIQINGFELTISKNWAKSLYTLLIKEDTSLNLILELVSEIRGTYMVAVLSCSATFLYYINKIKRVKDWDKDFSSIEKILLELVNKEIIK